MQAFINNKNYFENILFMKWVPKEFCLNIGAMLLYMPVSVPNKATIYSYP